MKKIRIDLPFYRRFLIVAIPIAVQQLLKAMMFFIDNIMIGSLGENAIVGVGNANQIAFFVLVVMIGICGTGWVFAARFNGQGDKQGIQRTLGVCLVGTLAVGLVFFVMSQAMPRLMIGVFSTVPGVQQQGGDYIQIVGISYVFTAVSLSYNNVLKGCQKTRLPMIASGIAIVVNAFLNYVLIFGKLGFPEMGVKGAAIGTAVGSFIDAALLVAVSNIKKNETAGSPKALFPLHTHMRQFARQFVRVGAPMMVNEFLWALSAMALILLYNRMGLEVAAAMAVFAALERMAYVVYIGIAHSSGVMVGNQLGAGRPDTAYVYGKRFLRIAPISTLFVGAALIAVMPAFLAQYDIGGPTLAMTKNVVYTFVGVSCLMTFNFTNIVGVMRGGGDTRFGMKMDLAGSWLVTLPVAFVTGLVLHWPIHIVYLCGIAAGDTFKLVVGIWRFVSKKWIHDITSQIRSVSTLVH